MIKILFNKDPIEVIKDIFTVIKTPHIVEIKLGNFIHPIYQNNVSVDAGKALVRELA